MVAIAVLAWGAVIYGGIALSAAAHAHALSAGQASAESASSEYATRLNVLANATTKERAELDSIVPNDVVSIANAIDAVGERTGVPLRVSDAVAEGSPITITGGELQPVLFLIQGSGDFSDLMRASMLIEKLPLPISVESVAFDKDATEGWQMTLRIRVITNYAAAQ